MNNVPYPEASLWAFPSALAFITSIFRALKCSHSSYDGGHFGRRRPERDGGGGRRRRPARTHKRKATKAKGGGVLDGYFSPLPALILLLVGTSPEMSKLGFPLS